MTSRSVALQVVILLVSIPWSVTAQSRAPARRPSIVAEVMLSSFSKNADRITFGIQVTVPPNHHGYLDKGDDGFLIPFTFSFPALEEAEVRIEEPDRPAGVRDERFRARVLRGRAEFLFRLAPTRAVPSPISATLRYQICNDRTAVCYPPAIVRIPLEIN